MKKKQLWFPLLALLAVLIAAWAWFSRPMTLAQLCPDFRWDQLTTLDGFYSPINLWEDTHRTVDSVSPQDPDAQAVAALLSQTTLRRSLWDTAQSNLTFLGTKSTVIPDGCPAFDIHLNLRDEESFLYLQLTGNNLTVSYIPFQAADKGRIWGCALSDPQPLWTALTSFIDNHRR